MYSNHCLQKPISKARKRLLSALACAQEDGFDSGALQQGRQARLEVAGAVLGIRQ